MDGISMEITTSHTRSLDKVLVSILSTLLAGGSVWLEFGLILSGESPPVELQT